MVFDVMVLRGYSERKPECDEDRNESGLLSFYIKTSKPAGWWDE